MTTATPTTHRLEVRGQTTTYRTSRRFAVVIVRAEAIPTAQGTFVAFAEVRSSTNSAAKAKVQAAKVENGPGCVTVVIDLITGEEV